MRIRRVTFRCFGPFQEKSLNFDGPGGLRVVYGANEAGKSSALRGLRNLLFGFDGATPDKFRYPYSLFRIAASLENATGQTLEIVRRKAKIDSLRAANDKDVLPEAKLCTFLGELDEDQFDQLFGMDAERFAQGGREIAAGKGEVGQALFAAAAGLKGMLQLQRSLDERRDAIFKPGARVLPLNKAISEYQECLKHYKSLVLPPEKYLAVEEQARRDREQHSVLKSQQRDEMRRRDRLKSHRAALPIISLLQQARHDLEAVKDAPRLSEDFDRRAQQVISAQAGAATRREQLEVDIRNLAAELVSLPPADADLGFDIDAIQKDHGVDEAQRKERIDFHRLGQSEEDAAKDIFKELTGSKKWTEMEELNPTLEQRKRIHELAQKADLLLEHRDRTSEAVREAELALNELERLPALPEAWLDTHKLAAAVQSIREQGKLELVARQRRNSCDALTSRLATSIHGLVPAVPHDWQSAATVPIPSAAVVRKFEAEFRSIQSDEAAAIVELQALDQELASLNIQLQDATRDAAIPSESELRLHRNQRDRGFGLIRQRLEGHPNEDLESAYITETLPERSLADATDSGIRQSDTIVDRLRVEADQLALLRSARQRQDECRQLRTLVQEKLAGYQQARMQLQQRWLSAWQASGVVPDHPEAMIDWLTNWQGLVAQVRTWGESQQACQEDDEQIRRCREQLLQFEPLKPASGSLVEILAAADAFLQQQDAAKALRAQLERDDQRLRHEFAAARHEADAAQHNHECWKKEWTAAIAVLRLQESAPSVATVRDYVEKIERMQQHLKDARIKRSRVKAIDETRANYLERLTSAQLALNPNRAPTTESTIDEDFRFVKAAADSRRIDRTRRDQLEKQREGKESSLREVIVEYRKSEAALALLLAEACVDAPTEIASAQQRARQRNAAEKRVSEQAAALAQCAFGEELEVFARAALAEQDDIDGKIAECDEKIQSFEIQMTEAETKALESERLLAEIRKGSETAAGFRQQMVLMVGTIRDRAIEYAALHIAIQSLTKAKERYRARHQGTMLTRAGHFFRILTSEAFSEIDFENDEGQDVLVGVRAGSDQPDHRVRVEGLSDGTRDQLFLALRLAGIERHLENREPIPLILDDLLINFDDVRAAATLKCLVELSSKTQVMIFTHHKHLVELAKLAEPNLAIINL